MQQKGPPIKLKHVARFGAEKINPLGRIVNSVRVVGSREHFFLGSQKSNLTLERILDGAPVGMGFEGFPDSESSEIKA